MEKYTKQITPEMTETVNRLLESGFKDATAEDIETYATWKSINALQDAVFADKRKEHEDIIKANIKASEELSTASMNALNALTELAKAKLKAVENGKA